MFTKMLGYTCFCCIGRQNVKGRQNSRLKLLKLVYVLLRSRGARMYRTPIHFGALCKSTYNLTTRQRQNRYGRQNVRLYVHRGAAAKMFHFNFTVIICFSHISSLFFFFFFFSFFLFFLFLFSPFLSPPSECRPGESPPLPPLGTPLQLAQ